MSRWNRLVSLLNRTYATALRLRDSGQVDRCDVLTDRIERLNVAIATISIG